jgi:hypothetical protein
MRRLVQTARGTILIDRNGPFGSLYTFEEDGWEAAEVIFHGRRQLVAALEQLGLSAAEATSVAVDYWATWERRFADPYYAEARRFVRRGLVALVAAGLTIVALVSVAVSRRRDRSRRRN